MMYPTGTPVHTFTLDAHPGEGNLTSPVFIMVRDTTGELFTTECEDYRTAMHTCERYEDAGMRILAVVEGEKNLATGEATVWTR